MTTPKTTDPSASNASSSAPSTTSTTKAYPTLPTFTHDPSNSTGAASWFRRVEMKLKFCNGITNEEKVTLVCCALDEESFNRIERALLPADITTYANWDEFKKRFIGLYDTQRSLFADRYAAFKLVWDGPAHEPIQEFVSRIRQAVALFKCAEFGDNELSTMLLLTSMKAPALEPLRSLLLNSLIKDPKADLGAVTTLLDNALMTERDQKLPEERQLNIVKKIQPHQQQKKGGFGAHRRHQPASLQTTSSKPPPTPCYACGGPHWNRDCPYKDAKCHECGLKGHLPKMCPKKSNAPRGGRIQSSNTGKKPFKKYVGTVRVLHLNTPSATVTRKYFDVSINGRTIKLQWDTGSDMTILTPRDYHRCGSPKLLTSSVKACSVNNERIKLDGYFSTMVKCKNVSKQMDVHVAEIPGSLLGLDFCDSMEVQFTPNATATVATVTAPTSKVSASPKTSSTSIKDVSAQSSTATATRNDASPKATVPGSRTSSTPKPLVYCKSPATVTVSHTPKVDHRPASTSPINDIIQHLQSKYASVFQAGLGRCTQKFIHLQLKPNAKRIFVPVRRMSQQGLEVAKAELARLEQLGVMEKHDGGNLVGCTPGSIVKRKDGRPRFVVDYSTGLNDQLEEPSYQLPIPEDIFDQFSGCKFFTQQNV